MSNLMLHCGANLIERNALYGLPEPTSLGKRHSPVHHADFVDMLEGSLRASGFAMHDLAVGVTHNGNRLFGLAEVGVPGLPATLDTAHTIGFRGSHDQTVARSIAAGANVFVCDNLSFSGEVVMNTKQTSRVHDRLPAMIEQMLERLRVVFGRQNEQFDSYRTTQITPSAADAALLALGRENIINWSELGKVVAEYEHPTHPEHAEDGETVWRLFNAATEVLKPRNPEHPRLPTLPSKTIKLHRICDKLAA